MMLDMLRSKYCLFWLLSAAFIGFYLWILALVIEPRVGHAYRLYYIEQQLAEWPGSHGLNYEWGSIIDFSQKLRFLSSGWGEAREEGRVIEKSGAAMFLVLKPMNRDEVMRLDLMAFADGLNASEPLALTVFVNNVRATTVELDNDSELAYEIILPKKMWSLLDGYAKVEFRFENPVSKAIDSGEVRVGVKSARFSMLGGESGQ